MQVFSVLLLQEHYFRTYFSRNNVWNTEYDSSKKPKTCRQSSIASEVNILAHDPSLHES